MESHSTAELPEDMIDEIQFEIPEAPYDSVVHHLRRSAVKFCEESHYWQEEIDPLVVLTGVQSYDLSAARTVAIVSVIKVSSIDRELCRSQDDAVQYRYWQPSPFTIDIFPSENLSGQEITILASLKPALYSGNFKVSTSLISDYRDALIAGAKSMLYKTPRKAWTDLNQAQINQYVFDEDARDSLLMRSRGYSRLPDRSVSKKRNFY